MVLQLLSRSLQRKWRRNFSQEPKLSQMRWKNTDRARRAKNMVVKRLSVIQQEFSLSEARVSQRETLIRESLDFRENVTCSMPFLISQSIRVDPTLLLKLVCLS